MKKLSSADVRQMFLDFFKEKNHRVEPSASLVPVEDPSLLWINSGVATLKKYFDGRVVPENPRIVNAQKAIRTNDIENVGYTARHHTFFEMLGNFSIGEYFKKEAIHWAWEFLTSPEWIGFEPEKLSVTIHPEDDEAYQIWHDEIGLPDERIIRLEENFWDIGEGPSGPNTEIFYDQGESYGNDPDDPELFPGGENERYLEIWNLVFSQFNHNPDGTYTPLPNKNIDTGMGLERMVKIIQSGRTNFDTDLFQPIIKKIEELSGAKYGETAEKDTAFKVIADHVRSVSFAISDGAMPSNEGRGYVLRRLIRRAVRFAMELGLDRPFMSDLVPIVEHIMRDFYTELSTNVAFVQKVIKNEEERFHETIHEGLSILNDIIAQAKAEKQTVISGEDAFRLYDTFGFPVELTEEYAAKEGLQIDLDGFERALEAQRARARSARQSNDSMQVQNDTLRKIDVESEFIGYNDHHTEAKVTAIILNDEPVDFAQEGDHIQLFLDKTPFYAESGGQIGDKGELMNPHTDLMINDVKKAPKGQNLHFADVQSGQVKVGDTFEARVFGERRSFTEKNHTATHLLHQALKDTLGTHVNQAGSLVTPERLRFDFSHFGQVTEEELKTIETAVNEKIWENLKVSVMEKPIAEAKAMGAMALFGEKYGDVVRVVQIGDYSLELCGGCHVRQTSEIGLFSIVSETGIGAGTRRIEAMTGKAAYTRFKEYMNEMQIIAQTLKTSIDLLPERIDILQGQMKSLEKENESLQAKIGQSEATGVLNKVENVSGVNVLAQKVNVGDMNQLRTMLDQLKSSLPSAIIVLASVDGGKVNLAAMVTKDLTERGFHAGKLIKEVAGRCGGGGGGRPDMAQAGGKHPEKVAEALAYVKEYALQNV